MVRIAIAGLVLALLGGCKADLNPAYCAAHRDDIDCLVKGDLVDAPDKPECTASAECAGNTNGGVCDVAAGRCVLCIDGLDKTACTGATTVCGADQLCHGCVTDGDCASGVCLGTQSCAMQEQILYAIPMPTGPATCMRTAPCTFTAAVGMLDTTHTIIKLSRVPGMDYMDAPVSITGGGTVQIIGTGASWKPTGGAGGADAITVTGTTLEIVGLTIQSAAGDNIHCSNGALNLRAVSLLQSPGYGVESDNCDVTITRSILAQHTAGALFLVNGTHEIRNNFIHDNGDAGNDKGVVVIANGTGRFRFNTVARTASKTGASKVGGIGCSKAAGGFVVAQNLIAAWGFAGIAIGGDCTERDNYFSQNIGLFGFVDPTSNFHLTAASPEGSIRDAATPDAVADCEEGDGHIDDIDGQPRPFPVFCDRGADEYRP